MYSYGESALKNILEADSVILHFGLRKILQDIYVKCETGLGTALMGRNGCGKTSLLRVIFGELGATDSSVRINGESVFNSKRRYQRIKYLPQFNFIPQSFRVRDVFQDFNLDFEKFKTLFPNAAFEAHTRIRDLSGGQQRLVEAYIILMSESEFCLLDEPFTQISPVDTEVLKNLILTEKHNKGILISDHLYRDVLEVCDVFYVMNNGTTRLRNSEQDLINEGYITKATRFSRDSAGN
ncbi:MAG: ATP-binding cassette domain-containing protein [Bacteroidetes bacterium]|nr:ATP-binding cassette domain-containing protein [Bacteroidota bacterium]